MTGFVKRNIGEQIAELLERQPQNYDVVFSVGPDKMEVKGVKIILKAASPVFEREFVENWEIGVMKEGEGIPLLNIDPTVFKLFINLIISDGWEADQLKSLNLAPNTLLSLLGLCRRFMILKAIENLEVAALEFIQSFQNYKNTPEFLEMSRENLETVFASEIFPRKEIEIFECACRWAEHQCQQKNIEPTGENYRKVLGGCLFKIRFREMELQDFTAVSCFKKNIFSAEEKVEIYDFIGKRETERVNSNMCLLPFNTIPSLKPSSFEVLAFYLPDKFEIKANPLLRCKNEVNFCNGFQVNEKITLYGIGFLGPVDEDAYYDVDVTVQIQKRYSNVLLNTHYRRLQTNIFAPKGRVFYFIFDQPINIMPNSPELNGESCFIEYNIKGPIELSRYIIEGPAAGAIVKMPGVDFIIDRSWGGNWNSGSSLAELVYIKIQLHFVS